MEATKLVDELCSLLDEATILSICSDFDLSKPEEFQSAREILLSISKDVEAEEATGFNPSGLGAHEIVDITGAASDASGNGAEARPDVSESDLKSNDGHTSTTESSAPHSLPSGASSKTSVQDASDTFRLGLFDGLPDEEKALRLGEMFTSLKPIDVELALKKVHGDADLACDLLLTTSLLEQTGLRPKGVEGFYIPDDEIQSKKRKGKKKKTVARTVQSAGSSSTNLPSDPSTLEQINRDNIVYLAERLPLQEADVEIIYFQQNSSMGATVTACLDNYMAALCIGSHISYNNTSIEEAAKKYPWIPAKYIAPTFEITSPARQHALDLLEILAAFFEKPAYLRYDISYNLTASSSVLESMEGTGGGTSGRGWSNVAKSKAPAYAPPSGQQAPGISSSDLAAMRNHSFASARTVYRKGGLYRQAATVFSERGHEHATNHRVAISAEAAHLVDRSSTSNRIDLHGVTVQDGVNIALERTWQWWNGLGEDRARRAKEGFEIVTGLGRHSTDGKSRLRINVFKALVADGWKVVVLTGHYLVTGRGR